MLGYNLVVWWTGNRKTIRHVERNGAERLAADVPVFESSIGIVSLLVELAIHHAEHNAGIESPPTETGTDTAVGTRQPVDIGKLVAINVHVGRYHPALA